MMKVKTGIAVVIWLLVIVQAVILFDSISKSSPVNLWLIIGIMFVNIVLAIIQFSIKVK